MLELSHPLLAGELPISLPRLTPVTLAPALEVSDYLLARVVDELTAACTDDTVDHLNQLYGWSTGKLIRHLVDSNTALGNLEVTRSIAQAMCETLQTTGPSRTVLGRTILAHATRLINMRQGAHVFHVDLSNAAEREAERGAARIKSALPHYDQVIGTILERSAVALRQHALAKGVDGLRMFRGLRGDNIPRTIDGISQTNYPMRPLTSWSTTFKDAEHFAHEANGVVVEGMVPSGCLAISPGFAEEEIMLFPVALDVAEPSIELHEITVVAVHAVDG